MENIFLTVKEHRILKKNKKRLENSHGVQILMPKVEKTFNQNDLIFTTICGRKDDIKAVQDFISRTIQNQESNMTNVTVITLSDSEDSSDLQDEANSSVQIIGESNTRHLDESVIIVDETKSLADSTSNNETNVKKKKKVRKNIVSSSVSDLEMCEVTSTTVESNKVKKRRFEEVEKDGGDDVVLAPDFLSLNTKPDSSNSPPRKDNLLVAIPDSSNDIKNHNIKRPLKVPRCLRPIVIDGSNVAREHGKSSNTFSSKGIQIAVDYFLNRGHTSVTAFVPKFRRHYTTGKIPTTDPEILESLHSKNHVVFTPSRKLNGMRISSYDDRFIVDLASRVNGIIVSNDNFRDLVSENDGFKKAIEERLLMFCFAGDIFMVPEDPLGRDGPSLDEYLSFPDKNNDEKDEEKENEQKQNVEKENDEKENSVIILS